MYVVSENNFTMGKQFRKIAEQLLQNSTKNIRQFRLVAQKAFSWTSFKFSL